MRLPVRWRLVLSIGLPLVAVYGAVLAVAFVSLRATAYRNVERQLHQVAQHQAARFDAKLRSAAQVARSTASFLNTQTDVTEDELYELLTLNVEQSEQVYGSCVAFEPGSFRADRFAPYVWRSPTGLRRMDVVEAYDYTDGTWEWYSAPSTTGKALWTEPFFDEGAGDVIMCTHAVPFYRNGKLWGVSTIDVKLEDMQKDVGEAELEGGWFVILSRAGSVISHPDPSYILKETVDSIARRYDQPEVYALGRRLLAGESGVTLMRRFPRQQPHFVAYAPIESLGWQFCVAVPRAVVLAPVWTRLAQFSAIMLVGLLLIVGILFFASFRITHPMRRLVAAAQELSAGNLDTRAEDVDSPDEIGDLGRAFNKMIGDLKSHVDAQARETAARQVLESELKVAREIQAALLPLTFPPFPERREFDLHALNLPAQLVAGDFYDFFFISDDVLGIVIADVAGKGMPAAMLMGVTQTIVLNLAMTGESPAQILRNANRFLLERITPSRPLFVTLFIGHYHTKTGRLHYANAAHPVPYRVDDSGGVEPIGTVTAGLLGIFPEQGQRFAEGEAQLEVGDSLMLYTDGVTEALSEDGEYFGDERLVRALSRFTGDGVERCCLAIVEEVRAFQPGELSDDVTLLMLRRNH